MGERVHQTMTMPEVAYASVFVDKRGFRGTLVGRGGQKIVSELVVASQLTLSKAVEQWLAMQAQRLTLKIVAVGLGASVDWDYAALGAHLWLQLDIVPHLLPATATGSQATGMASAQMVAEQYDGLIAHIHLGPYREVLPSFLVTQRDVRKSTDPKRLRRFEKEADRFKRLDGEILFLSSTPAGGGVALMRHALIRLFRLVGVAAHWHVLKPKPDVFAITKRKFHNVLQAIAPKEDVLTSEEKKVYLAWIAENARALKPVILRARVIVIDDPQPSGLIPLIKEMRPDVKIIYRSHIQLRTDLMAQMGTAQEHTWRFLKDAIFQADVFVSHPIRQFIPRDIPKKRVVLMPATTDFLDGLNKRLTKEQRRYYRQVFNELLITNGQTPLSFRRPYIIQVARFDPSKGIPDVIEAYRRLRKRLSDTKKPKTAIPQLVIVGNGAIDDPEGLPMFQEIRFLLEMDRYRDIASDVKVARVPHIDQMLNALLADSAMALQLSHREGFEVKVTEALHAGRPVIAYRTGGIPLQILHEVTGFLVRTGDTKQVAERLVLITTDIAVYKGFLARIKKQSYDEFGTVANATRWLYLANELLEQGAVKGLARAVDGLIDTDKSGRAP